MKKSTDKFLASYESIKSSGGKIFPEPLVKQWLADAGVPVPLGKVFDKSDDAVKFASKLKYPVVLKIVSDRVLHKTELGGVAVGISSDKELKAAFNKMKSAAKSIGFQGILVEKQAAAGVEIIAGLQNDPHFGPVLMLGMGGIFTDLLKDVAFRMLPVTKRDVEDMLKQLKSAALLDGFRGGQKADRKSLVDAILKIAKFGESCAEYFDSADFNPIIAAPTGACVVDAKIVLADKPHKSPFFYEKPRTHHMQNFFTPKSVAVIGASATPGKIGNVIVDSLANYDFKGKVYPINPTRSEICGVKCYPSLRDIPKAPDLAIIVVELGSVPAIMHELAESGVHNMLIVSGGGKELGGERENIEDEIVMLSRKLDIRIIGPNCIGMFDGAFKFDSFFYHQSRMTRPPAGPMSFITQSGTWGCAFLEFANTIGVSKMVSYGNRTDVDEGDLIAYLAADKTTKAIGSYIEGLANGKGRKFIHSIKEATKQHSKPVVVFKTGRNPRSAQAAVSHTGAYGGSYQVYRDVFKQGGVIAVDSFHELYAASKALALQPAARGPRCAMLSNGAGPMVNALDLFPQKGLELVTIDRGSVKKMRDKFSFFYIVENPVDVTGSASAADYDFVIRTLLADDNVDIIMPFFVFQNTPLDESIIERMDAINKKSKKPIICCAAGGRYKEKMSAALESIGIPVMPDVVQWVAAASALAQWGAMKPAK